MDNEVGGYGNSYTAEFWQYDPRLGRRWNVDPITYPWQGSYTAFNSNPIFYTDPLGLEGEPKGKTRDFTFKSGVEVGGGDEEETPKERRNRMFAEALYDAKQPIMKRIRDHNSKYDQMREEGRKEAKAAEGDAITAEGEKNGYAWYRTKGHSQAYLFIYDNCRDEEFMMEVRNYALVIYKMRAGPLANMAGPDNVPNRYIEEVLEEIYQWNYLSTFSYVTHGEPGLVTVDWEFFIPWGAGVTLGKFLLGVVRSRISAAVAARATKFINLASGARTTHILAGDATGGGHAWFASLKSFKNGITGKKTMFPATWSKDEIMHAVSYVATNNKWVQQSGKAGAAFTNNGAPVRYVVTGYYKGVKIKVVTTATDIITAYPIK